jgi:hypothetical protein
MTLILRTKNDVRNGGGKYRKDKGWHFEMQLKREQKESRSGLSRPLSWQNRFHVLLLKLVVL